MTMLQFLATLRARYGVALVIVLLTVLATVVTGQLLPRKYVASASLVIDAARADPLAASSQGGGWGAGAAAYMATQIDILRSDRVALEVVHRLRQADDAQTVSEWAEATQSRGRIEDWLAQRLQKALVLNPARDSSVLTLTVEAPSADAAALIANTWAQAYLDLSVQLRTDPARAVAGFFDTQSQALRAKVEQAQARLTAYQRDKGVIVGDDRVDLEQTRMMELSSQLIAVQAVASESASRQALAQSAAERSQDLVANPNVAALRGELTRAEAKLQEMGARFGERHPQVQEAEASLIVLRSRLEAETRRVVGSVVSTSTISRHREAELKAELDAQRGRVLHLKSVRDAGQTLLRDVENAQRAFDGLQSRVNQASLESRVTQSGAYLLAAAVAPLDPASPRQRVNAGLSLVGGLLLAIGAVIALEMVDPRLRTADAVPLLLGLPLLGVLPRPGGRGDFAARRIPLVAPHVMGRLAAPRQG